MTNNIQLKILLVISLVIYIWITRPYFCAFFDNTTTLYNSLNYNDYYVGTLAVLSFVTSFYYFDKRRSKLESSRSYIQEQINTVLRKIEDSLNIVIENENSIPSTQFEIVSNSITISKELLKVLSNDKYFTSVFTKSEIKKIETLLGQISDILTDDVLIITDGYTSRLLQERREFFRPCQMYFVQLTVQIRKPF